MASSVGQIYIDLVMDKSGLEKGSKEAETALKDLGATVDTVEKRIKASFAAAGAAAAGYAVALAKISKTNIDLIATQGDLASSMNATVTGLRAVNRAAADNSIGDLDGSLARFTRRLGAVEKGGGPAADAIKKLGLNTRELASVDADEKLAMIADAIQKSGVSSQQATRYLQDMGFEQRGVYNVFKNGGDALRAYRGEVERLGTAVDEIDVIKIQMAGKAMSDMSDSVDGLTTQLAVQMAPIMGEVAKQFNTWASESIDGVTNVERAIDALIDIVGFAADAFHGVKVAGVVAFESVRAGLYGVNSVVFEFYNTIVDKAIGGLNLLIEAANKLPMVDIPLLEMPTMLADMADVNEQLMRESMDRIHEALMEPLPSEGIRKFVEDAKQAWEESAKAALAAKTLEKEMLDELEAGWSEEELAKLREKAEKEMELLRQYGMSEMELLQEQHDQRQELLQTALERQRITEAEFAQATIQNRQMLNDALAALDKQRFDDALSQAQNYFGVASTLMNSHSRKMFELGKVAAIANAIVSTAQGVTKALELGYPVGLFAAAAVGAAGAVQIANIRRQKFGSMSGSGMSATTAVSEAAAPALTTQQQSSKTIYLSGIDANSYVKAGTLVEALNEEMANGGQLVIG